MQLCQTCWVEYFRIGIPKFFYRLRILDLIRTIRFTNTITNALLKYNLKDEIRYLL